jgi:integrase
VLLIHQIHIDLFVFTSVYILGVGNSVGNRSFAGSLAEVIMPSLKRINTEYPGVYFIEGTAVATGKPERIYYIRYRKNGKGIDEKVGRQFQNDMTPARAARIRANRIEGRELPNTEKREVEEATKQAEENRWTIDKLWSEYKAGRQPGKSLSTDKGRYEKYLGPSFGDQEPKDIIPLDVERLKRKLLKKKSPQTVKHVLNLFTWIVHFGVKQGLCPGLSFHVKKPTVDNEKTEDLTQAQLKKLLLAIGKDTHDQAGNIMLLALYTGMRRGEMFKLQWKHVDFERGFITLVDTKGGKDQLIPLNDATRGLLNSIKRVKDSSYVFPGRKGSQRVDINKALAEIKEEAGLPKTFRPLHGLRHVYASQLASSGQVDMYVLQRLLTHKDPRMTQRYAHLRDDTLKKAANLAGKIITTASATKVKSGNE